MTSTPTHRRWSFRTRLTAIMAATFAASGAALVLVQYLIFNVVFSSTAMSVLNVSVDGVEQPPQSGNPATDVHSSAQTAESMSGVTVDAMASDVLAETMLWSLLLVAVFAMCAWLLAWIVARRAMRRVHQISATAKEITEQDLSRRLDLPGPEDEIKELGDTIDSMLARLQSSFEAQSRFIANASHELRTPLTATRLSLEVPLEQGRVPEQARSIVERALKTTKRSERLVESLLTLARDPAILLGQAEPVDMGDLVSTVAEEARPSAESNGIDLRLDLSVREVHGSAVLLRQLVENLVDNAIAHNRMGGTIEIGLLARDRAVELVVTSTGVQLDPDQVDRLRQPFERNASKDGRNRVRTGRPGIGLGLSIVESIAAAHHGSLELTARPGGGLRVVVLLPAGGDRSSNSDSAAADAPELRTQ